MAFESLFGGRRISNSRLSVVEGYIKMLQRSAQQKSGGYEEGKKNLALLKKGDAGCQSDAFTQRWKVLDGCLWATISTDEAVKSANGSSEWTLRPCC